MSSSLFDRPGSVVFRGRSTLLSGICLLATVVAFCMTGYSSPQKDPQPDAGRVWIDGFPRDKSRPVDPFSQSVAMALTSAGHPTDWLTVMGDSGMAFVMQASEVVPLIGPDGKKAGDAPKDLGKVVGRRDVGWWPLASECEPTYIEFVGRVAGRELRVLGSGDYPGPKGLAVRYKKMRDDLVASIDNGRPVPVRGRCQCGGCFWSVAVGYDKDEPALWSICPLAGPQTQAKRIAHHPVFAIVLGEKIEKLDRRQADRQSLRHAVALARDEVKMPNDYLTGQRAYALWASELRQMDPPGQARWHANVRRGLTLRRRAAVAYLEAMSRRHDGPTRTHLLLAVDQYRKVLSVLKTADTSSEAMTSAKGREALAKLAERLAGIEAKAALQLEQAANSIRPTKNSVQKSSV